MFEWASSVTRRCFLWASGGLIASLWPKSHQRVPADAGLLTADEILARMGEAYANCRTYCDSGCVETRFLTAAGETDWVCRKPFATAFVRPDRFRFEFKSHHPRRTEWHRYIVCARGEEVSTWWDIRPGVRRPESLSLALAGATGVSGGSAHIVPSLLMPDRVGGVRMTGLRELTRLGNARLGQIECYRVRGRFVIDPEEAERCRREIQERFGRTLPAVDRSPVTLWVEKETFLLRRIEEQTRSEELRTDTVTTYDPRAEGPVTEQQLQFDPPPDRV
jgi:hypothetical protein